METRHDEETGAFHFTHRHSHPLMLSGTTHTYTYTNTHTYPHATEAWTRATLSHASSTHTRPLLPPTPPTACVGEYIVSGAGELHLEVCLSDLSKLLDGWKLDVSEPAVAYREGSCMCVLFMMCVHTCCCYRERSQLCCCGQVCVCVCVRAWVCECILVCIVKSRSCIVVCLYTALPPPRHSHNRNPRAAICTPRANTHPDTDCALISIQRSPRDRLLQLL